jgi:predicted DNA-binding transcriptional regulator
MNDSSKQSLLEQLRKESAAVRALDVAARRPLEKTRQDINRRLWDAFQWLDEAVSHLSVIRPKITRQFRLSDVLTIDRPRFDRGFVAFRRRGLVGHEVLDHVEMRYVLAGTKPLKVRIGINAVTEMEERLRTSMLQFQYETQQDEEKVIRHGIFHVQPTISASVRFQPDYLREVIKVTLHNVDRFESVLLDFPPDAIEERALEDLVRLMLGESDRFLHLAPLALIGSRSDQL